MKWPGGEAAYDTELVALGVGHDDPAGVGGCEIGGHGAESLQAGYLPGLVVVDR